MFNRCFALAFVLLFQFQTHAADVTLQIENSVSVPNSQLAAGSSVQLQSSKYHLNDDMLFLGEAVLPNTSATYALFLNKKTREILYINADSIQLPNTAQKILNPYEQAGGTCTGYAIYDFLLQTNLAGFQGNGQLSKRLSDERGRTNLLVDNINEYYLTPQHRYSVQGILNKYGRDLGFSCRTYTTDSFDKAKSRILEQLQKGLPVMIGFNIGPDMNTSPFALKTLQTNMTLDNRVWTPRKVGERNSGGHTVVAAASFEFENKTYLVMLDSDWSEPRIWDVDSFLGDRTALTEVELTTCK